MKLYFDNEGEGHCYPLDYFSEQLDEVNEEITVYPAKMLIGESFFYCSEFQETGEVGECGRECSEYKPRNGKNGRCVHSKNCYEPDYTKLKVLKLTPTNKEDR